MLTGEQEAVLGNLDRRGVLECVDEIIQLGHMLNNASAGVEETRLW